MIFLTVGTTSFSFDRLFSGLDQALLKLAKREKLIAQINSSDYKFSYSRAKTFRQLPFNKVVDYIKEADWVITHGGFASIYLASQYARNEPIIVPRSQGLGEHIDNHQIEFCRFWQKQGNAGKIIFPEELVSQAITEAFARGLRNNNPSKTRPDRLVKNLANFVKRATT